MRKLIFVFIISIIGISISAQKLIDIYKQGTVKLIPDPDYAKGNNWNVVFKTYYDTIYNTPMGERKSLKLMPDGSVVVNHAYRNYYSKFNPDGKFEKEFGIKNAKGEQLKKINAIEGIINNNTFFTGLDNMGNMICFDFNGNYEKTLKLDYMTNQMIPLPNSKIAVVGWVMWSSKFRDFISIVDYSTNQQKVIWEHFTDRKDCGNNIDRPLFNYSFKTKKGYMVSINTMPFSKSIGLTSRPIIESVGNNLVVGVPTSGDVLVYDLDGNLKSKGKISWERTYISVDEQKAIQQKAIDKYKKMKDIFFDDEKFTEDKREKLNTLIQEMEDDLGKINTPIPLPAFSSVIKDSDGNLLFFEFPKEENTNKFNVWIYQNSGKFVCQSSFVCDDYNLVINSSKMVFYKGYIYALETLKKSEGVPLRLVRFRVTSNK